MWKEEREEKMFTDTFRNNTDAYCQLHLTLLYFAHIFIVIRLSPILISYWASYNKPRGEHAESGFLRSPQLRANPALGINCILVRFASRLLASRYTELRETENTD